MEIGHGLISSYGRSSKGAGSDFSTIKVEATEKVGDGSIYVFGDFYSSEGFQPELNRKGVANIRDQEKEKKYLQIKYTNGGLTMIASINEYRHPYSTSDDNQVRFFIDDLPLYSLDIPPPSAMIHK